MHPSVQNRIEQIQQSFHYLTSDPLFVFKQVFTYEGTDGAVCYFFQLYDESTDSAHELRLRLPFDGRIPPNFEYINYTRNVRISHTHERKNPCKEFPEPFFHIVDSAFCRNRLKMIFAGSCSN